MLTCRAWGTDCLQGLGLGAHEMATKHHARMLKGAQWVPPHDKEHQHKSSTKFDYFTMACAGLEGASTLKGYLKANWLLTCINSALALALALTMAGMFAWMLDMSIAKDAAGSGGERNAFE